MSKIVGQWEAAPPAIASSTHLVPVSGLAYYVSPPTTLSAMFRDPFHAIFYLMFTLTACAIFGKMWTEVSGTSVRDVARKMREQQIVMKGHRDTATVKVLARYIPIAAALGGICIGLLTVLADYMGSIGSGTGILLTVTIIYEFYVALQQLMTLTCVQARRQVTTINELLTTYSQQSQSIKNNEQTCAHISKYSHPH